MTSGAETPREDTLPDRILGGRFRVDHPLGRGGMATVHAGWQTAVDRPVAIKVVRADRASDPHALRALVDEARRASTVQHPHVVTILDCAHLEDGRPVIVMERLSGRSWGEWARADTPSVDRILTCARQIGAGLAAIHATGLLHGDLGPRNVFVREMAGLGPWVTLLDFGISRALGTVAGDRIWGTPGSMAPELWEGVAVDARADLWSLGVLLHLALTHRLPFPAAPDGLAAMRAGPDLAALAGRADLPPGLPDLLGALLAPHPDDRPDSATTVVQALDRLLERPAEPLTPSAEHAPGDRLPTGHVVERVLHRRGRWTEVRATRDGTFAEVCLYDTIPDDPVGALWLALARDLQPLVGRDSPPGLQSVHCAEFFGQTLCIAQPARTGERLSARLARTGPTPWRQVLRWGRQLARALGALHTSGTVHGWVHPSSVLIEDTDDQAILTGIGRRSLTALGVPALAPEVQAVTGLDRTHIDRTPASPSADWQALGETLLAALSGDLVVTSGPGARRRTAPSTVPPGVQRVLSRLATEARHIDGSDAVIAALDAVLAHPGEATTDLRRTLEATGPLLGRSPALDLLRGALDDALDGDGSVWHLTGPPGSGRTRLLDALVPLARTAGARVWRLDLPDPTRSGIARLAMELAHHLDAVPPPIAVHLRDRVARAVQPHLAVLAPLSPVFARLADRPVPDAITRPDPRALRLARSRALIDLMVAVCPPGAAPPVCLLIDDFEAMDASIGAFVAQLPLRAETLPLLCVVATGSGPLPDVRADDLRMARRHGALDYALPPLSLAHVEQLLTAWLGPTPAAALAPGAFALSGGWPGPLRTLLQHALAVGALQREGTHYAVHLDHWSRLEVHPDLTLHLKARLARRPPHVRAVLAAVAIWDTTTPVHVLAALTLLPPDTVVHAAVTAVQAGLLRSEDDGWSLAHPRIAALASAAIDSPAALHRRAARLLGPGHRLRVAHHLVQSTWAPTDRPHLEAAALDLLAGGRPGAARTLLDHLIAHDPDPHLRVLRARAHRQLGAEATAATDLLVAREALAADPLALAPVSRTLADVWFAIGRADDADVMLRDTLARLGVDHPPATPSGPALLWLVISQLVVAPGRMPKAPPDPTDPRLRIGPLLGALARVRLLVDPRQSLALGLAGLRVSRGPGDRRNMARGLAAFSGFFAQAVGFLPLSRRLRAAATALGGTDPKVAAEVETAILDGLFAEGRVADLAAHLPVATPRLVRSGTRVQLAMLAHARHRVAAHNGQLHHVLTNITHLAGLLEGAAPDGPATWLAELLFLRTCAMAGMAHRALHLVDARLAAFGPPQRTFDLWERGFRAARVGLLARMGRPDDALAAWNALGPDPHRTLRLHAADWSTEVLALWADSPGAATIPTALWRTSRRLSRPYPLFRLRLAVAEHDAALRLGRSRAAARALRSVDALARDLGGRPGAAVLQRAVWQHGGPTSPVGRQLLEDALEMVVHATPGLPDIRALHRLAGRPEQALPELPWAAAARSVGLGDLWDQTASLPTEPPPRGP